MYGTPISKRHTLSRMNSLSPSLPHELEPRYSKKPKRKINHLIFNTTPPQAEQFPSLLPTARGGPPVPQPGAPMTFRDAAACHSGANPHFPQLEEEDEISDDEEPPDHILNNPRCPIIRLSKEEKMRLRKPWKHTLIIKLFKAKIGYMSLFKRLKKKWALKGGMVLTDIGYEYFIARFSNHDDYNHVLMQGPWMLDDNYLTIRKWVPNFIPDDTPMRFLTPWIRIPHLAVEYFDKEFLHKVGSLVGKVRRIDDNTALAQRGQFTRLSVELDLTRPLLSKFWFKGRTWKIQYEGLKMICFHCGKIDHAEDRCPELNTVHMETSKDLVEETQIGPRPTIEENNFGSWMMVKKPPRRRPPRVDKPPLGGVDKLTNPNPAQPQVPEPNSVNVGSRFALLNEDNQGDPPKILGPVGVNPILPAFNASLEFETVDLGKASQQPLALSPDQAFHMGQIPKKPTNSKNSSNGIRKQKDNTKSSKTIKSKNILRDVTNEIPMFDATTNLALPSKGQQKENTSHNLQNPNEAIHSPTLTALDDISHIVSHQATDSHVFAHPSPCVPEHPTREDPMCGATLDGSILGSDRPPDSQIRDGVSLLGGFESTESRTHPHSQDSESDQSGIEATQ